MFNDSDDGVAVPVCVCARTDARYVTSVKILMCQDASEVGKCTTAGDPSQSAQPGMSEQDSIGSKLGSGVLYYRNNLTDQYRAQNNHLT